MNPAKGICPGCADVRTNRGLPCRRCWAKIPADMRRRFLVANRARTQQPRRFQEALIELLLWCREHEFG